MYLKRFNINSKQTKKNKTKMLLRGNYFQCRVFAMKSVQNLICFWRSSQNYFVLALFCSLHN
jgi:hypothetical protein